MSVPEYVPEVVESYIRPVLQLQYESTAIWRQFPSFFSYSFGFEHSLTELPERPRVLFGERIDLLATVKRGPLVRDADLSRWKLNTYRMPTRFRVEEGDTTTTPNGEWLVGPA